MHPQDTERWLEKSRALHHTNQSLQHLTAGLEQQLAERTAELQGALSRAAGMPEHRAQQR